MQCWPYYEIFPAMCSILTFSDNSSLEKTFSQSFARTGGINSKLFLNQAIINSQITFNLHLFW